MRGSAASTRTGGRVGIEGKVFEGQVRDLAPYALGEVKPRQSYTKVGKGPSASRVTWALIRKGLTWVVRPGTRGKLTRDRAQSVSTRMGLQGSFHDGAMRRRER